MTLTLCPDRYAKVCTPSVNTYQAAWNALGGGHSKAEVFNALQLSQEAEKLRRELQERDDATSQSDRPKEGADRLQEREAAAVERFKEALQDREPAAPDSQQSPFGYEVPYIYICSFPACRSILQCSQLTAHTKPVRYAACVIPMHDVVFCTYSQRRERQPF